MSQEVMITLIITMPANRCFPHLENSVRCYDRKTQQSPFGHSHLHSVIYTSLIRGGQERLDESAPSRDVKKHAKGAQQA